MSLQLSCVAVMNSFSLRIQRVNGCWDYAMACQTPFSGPALLFPFAFQIGQSQTRHSCTLQSDAFKCSRARALAETWERERVVVLQERSPLPGLTPALQGKCCWKDLQYSERLTSTGCQSGRKKVIFLKNRKAGLSPATGEGIRRCG